MAIRGVKTKIALNVALLLLISAVITDFLSVIVIQTVWVRTKIRQEHLHIASLGQLFFASLPMASGDVDDEALVLHKQQIVSTLLEKSDFQGLYIADAKGHYFFRTPHHDFDLLENTLNRAIQNHHPQQENIGYHRSFFISQPEVVILAAPVFGEHGHHGGIAALVSLKPIYEKLGQYNRFVFIYILLNTAILTLVGLYRIFKIYLRPIDRIVDQARKYQEEGDVFFAFRREDSELNHLSTALNHMLKRIADDKTKLKSAIASLKESNRELQQAQKEIVQAEKMASVGRLAAGIAHEIGNPIGIVLGYLDLLGQKDVSKQERSDCLQRAETEIQRINNIIRQLLDLARPREFKLQTVSVHTVIEELTDVMVIQPIMGHIELATNFQAFNDRLWADVDQLRQVLLNLLINAADAIHNDPSIDRGSIAIQTKNEPDPADPSGACLVITITDNGPGIPPEHVDAVFDPFFTTKEPGKGTGLGLAVSYTIIKKLKGVISVQSKVGQGTTFEIRFCPFAIDVDADSVRHTDDHFHDTIQSIKRISDGR